MAKKLPAIHLYTGDWLKDPRLSMCSPTTRGIWMDMLCAMHEDDRSGFLIGTPQQLSQICRCQIDEMEKAIGELKDTETADVSILDPNVNFCYSKVNIVNRRMFNDAKKRNASKLAMQKKRKSASCCTDVNSFIENDNENEELKGDCQGGNKVPAELPKATLIDPVAIENIVKAFPRQSHYVEALRAVGETIETLFNSRKFADYKSVLIFLQNKVKEYAEAVSKWPPGERDFIPKCSNWMNNGQYYDDPKTWKKSKQGKHNAKQSSNNFRSNEADYSTMPTRADDDF